MKPRLILRTVRPHDLNGINHIEELCFGQRTRFPPEALVDLIAAPNVSGVVAEAEGEMVGFLFLFVDQRKTDAVIITVDVHPDMQRNGIGKALLDHSISIARGLGKRRCLLQVGMDNVPAIGLYANVGFEKSGILKDYYGCGKDAWEMELSLQSK